MRRSTTGVPNVGVTDQVASLDQMELLQSARPRVRWVIRSPLLHSVALLIPLPNQLRHKVLLQLQATRKQQCRGVHPLTTVGRQSPTMWWSIRCMVLVCGRCLTTACPRRSARQLLVLLMTRRIRFGSVHATLSTRVQRRSHCRQSHR